MNINYNHVGVMRKLIPEEMEEAFREHLVECGKNKTETA